MRQSPADFVMGLVSPEDLAGLRASMRSVVGVSGGAHWRAIDAELEEFHWRNGAVIRVATPLAGTIAGMRICFGARGEFVGEPSYRLEDVSSSRGVTLETFRKEAAVIDRMFVTHGARSQGWSTRLTSHAIDWLRHEGGTRYLLAAADRENVGGLTVLRSLGFQALPSTGSSIDGKSACNLIFDF